jgi:hypothetical protein
MAKELAAAYLAAQEAIDEMIFMGGKPPPQQIQRTKFYRHYVPPHAQSSTRSRGRQVRWDGLQRYRVMTRRQPPKIFGLPKKN